MGELTDKITEEYSGELNTSIGILGKIYSFENWKNLQFIEDIVLKDTYDLLDKVGIYDEEKQKQLAFSFHDMLLHSSQLRPHNVRDKTYAPSENQKLAFSTLSDFMTLALTDLYYFPKDFSKQEIYLYGVQKLSKLNLPVAEGYVDLFNQIQEELTSGWNNRIVDTGGGRFGIAKEDE